MVGRRRASCLLSHCLTTILHCSKSSYPFLCLSLIYPFLSAVRKGVCQSTERNRMLRPNPPLPPFLPAPYPNPYSTPLHTDISNPPCPHGTQFPPNRQQPEAASGTEHHPSTSNRPTPPRQTRLRHTKLLPRLNTAYQMREVDIPNSRGRSGIPNRGRSSMPNSRGRCTTRGRWSVQPQRGQSGRSHDPCPRVTPGANLGHHFPAFRGPY